MNRLNRLPIAILLLLILWGTRILALGSLPLHNDEGLHLTRAIEVWNGHPFWNISDGKIINHWLIAAFYPQHEPVFVARIATIFIAMIGLAAGYALSLRRFGQAAGVLAGILWITSPYLFFYERLALSDAEAGALVVVTAWCTLRLARRGAYRDAIFTGLALGTATLFKFTAAPFALMVIVIILLVSKFTLRQRLILLGIAAATAAICFAPPLLYLFLRGDDFFSIALGWIGVSGAAGQGPAFVTNLARLWALLAGYGTLAWTALLIGGLVLLLILPRQRKITGTLLLAGSLPLLLIMIFGREVLPRHYVVALPLMLVLAGIGLGSLVKILEDRREQWVISGLVIAVLSFSIVPFMNTAYRDPGALPLPDEERGQFIRDHSGGFGLREAVEDFPTTITQKDIPIVASMFPDSCHRANFYAIDGLMMICTAAPGIPQIEELLAHYGAVYALVDNDPLIGVDVTILDAQATQIAAYPRPGETEDTASVVLWKLER